MSNVPIPRAAVKLSPPRRVVKCSPRTAAATRLARLVPDFAVAIVDECHHATATTYRTILEHIGAFRTNGARPFVVGVTATTDRTDGTGLDEMFESIVYERSLVDMVCEGYLADLRAKEIRLQADFARLHTRAGDFIEREAEAMLVAASAPEHIVAAYRQHAVERKAITFTPTVAFAHAVVRAFTAAGVTAAVLEAATPLDVRRATLAAFRAGTLRVIANCGIPVEGFDEPSIDCVVIARPTQSRLLYVQMAGRGARRYPGKADCLILDVVGATRHHTLITAASLLGHANLEDGLVAAIEGEEREARERAAEAEADALVLRGRLVAEERDLFHARLRQRATWIPVDARFVLSTADGYVELVETEGAWAVRHRRREAGADVLARGLSLEYAQGVGEDHVRRLGAAALIDPTAPWRSKPMSDKQQAALERCGLRAPPRLTRGEAADALTAYFARRR
jgi:superfamily II DNA or RNA helicase